MASGSIKDVKSKAQLEKVLAEGSPVVLHFWDAWCEASTHMDLVFSHLATDFPLVHFLRTELCRFSSAKIYPGRGIKFIRSDSQVFLFANSKCKRYFHKRLKPAKLCWTAMYQNQHKKDIAVEAVKKRHRATKNPYSRSIVGATLEVIQKKRAEKPEVRDTAREAALREIKERNKKAKDKKRAKKAETSAKSKVSSKGAPKAAGGKGPKLDGGGGKR